MQVYGFQYFICCGHGDCRLREAHVYLAAEGGGYRGGVGAGLELRLDIYRVGLVHEPHLQEARPGVVGGVVAVERAGGETAGAHRGRLTRGPVDHAHQGHGHPGAPGVRKRKHPAEGQVVVGVLGDAHPLLTGHRYVP